MSRYLTKSLFTTALDCPTRLYYAKNAEYPSVKDEDEFLQSLAEGGMQVGELACMYHPGGHAITTLDSRKAIDETGRWLEQGSKWTTRELPVPVEDTNRWLEQPEVTLYEPAFTFEDRFLIRVDVFCKSGNDVELIEVKAKSMDSDTEFMKQDGTIRSDWAAYLFDVAFQYWVMSQAHPEWHITPYLMLADKERRTTVEGLYQRFRVVTGPDGRKRIELKPGTTIDELGEPILAKVNVMEPVRAILEGHGIAEKDRTPIQKIAFGDSERSMDRGADGEGDRPMESGADGAGDPFGDWVRTLADYHQRNERYPVEIGSYCRNCEFRMPPDKLQDNEKSGFVECWKTALGWDDSDFKRPHIFDLWNGRGIYRKMLDAGKYNMDDLTTDDLPASPDGLTTKTGPWDTKERQTVQILAQTGGRNAGQEGPSILDGLKGDPEGNIILDGLYHEMQQWTWPLYLLDFEALRLAIPYVKGRRPYEQIAFQFSVHKMEEDGTVTHHAEWIHREPGTFPNFECVRQLKSVLQQDRGTIFQYSPFENTLLREVWRQLEQLQEHPEACEAELQRHSDHDELMGWIETVIKDGEREMVDLLKLLKGYHYHRDFGGSNSIKTVLPVILNHSEVLKTKYRQPYQGSNYRDMIWYREDAAGRAIDPYHLLPPVGFEELPDYETGEELIAAGGSAMIAYARMQFEDVPQERRDAVFNALLGYCELDTLAMVMLVEAWRGWFE